MENGISPFAHNKITQIIIVLTREKYQSKRTDTTPMWKNYEGL